MLINLLVYLISRFENVIQLYALIFLSFQNYPVHELSSFLFFIFPMFILVILYIRMGLRIRQTSEIQRNLPRSSFHGHNSINQAPQQMQQQQVVLNLENHELNVPPK